MEGEFREQHVRLTFREAVQLFEHRSQFIRRSSNACLVTKHLHYLLLAGARVGRKMYFAAVRNPRCSRNIFFHVTTVVVSGMTQSKNMFPWVPFYIPASQIAEIL